MIDDERLTYPGGVAVATIVKSPAAGVRKAINLVVRDLRDIVAAGNLRGAALRDRIDTKLRPDPMRFADARESMLHLFGWQTYADIMSHFAAGSATSIGSGRRRRMVATARLRVIWTRRRSGSQTHDSSSTRRLPDS